VLTSEKIFKNHYYSPKFMHKKTKVHEVQLIWRKCQSLAPELKHILSIILWSLIEAGREVVNEA
jgi:hypothetical protein